MKALGYAGRYPEPFHRTPGCPRILPTDLLGSYYDCFFSLNDSGFPTFDSHTTMHIANTTEPLMVLLIGALMYYPYNKEVILTWGIIIG